jgi:hypothetical protein
MIEFCFDRRRANPRWSGTEAARRRDRLGGLIMFCLGCSLLTAACSSSPKRPVLYPNAHYTTVGKRAADRDIDACIDMAIQHGALNRKSGRIAKQAATGAAVGGAGAGAWGLVRGDAGKSAAAGAAAGAATGVVRGAIKSSDPEPIHKQFVQRCLQKQGYEVIGWQ